MGKEGEFKLRGHEATSHHCSLRPVGTADSTRWDVACRAAAGGKRPTWQAGYHPRCTLSDAFML